MPIMQKGFVFGNSYLGTFFAARATTIQVVMVIIVTMLLATSCSASGSESQADMRNKEAFVLRGLVEKPYDIDMFDSGDCIDIRSSPPKGFVLAKAFDAKKSQLSTEAVNSEVVRQLIENKSKVEAIWILAPNKGHPCEVIELLGKLPNLKAIRFETRQRQCDLQALSDMTSIEHLEIEQDHVNNLDFLKGMKALKSLSLITLDLKKSDLVLISKLPKLQHLRILIKGSNKLDGLQDIKFDNLISIRLVGSGCDDNVCEWVASQNSLEYVSFMDAFNLTDNGLCSLKRLSRLKVLNIDCRTKASGQFLECLIGSNLIKLSVSLDNCDPKYIALLSQYKSLSDLVVHTLPFVNGATMNVFPYVGDLSNLDVLDLDYDVPLPEGAYMSLKHMKSLKALFLKNGTYSKEVQRIREQNLDCVVVGRGSMCQIY